MKVEEVYPKAKKPVLPITFVNLTPHDVTLYRLDWRFYQEHSHAILARWPKSESPLRLPECDLTVARTWIESDALRAGGNWFECRWYQGNYTAEVSIVERRLEITSLPEPVQGRLYIVALPVLMVVGHNRPDLVAPDTGPGAFGAVRDGDGNILGIQRFVSFAAVNDPAMRWTGPASEWEAANTVDDDMAQKMSLL
jgi:hypothetical protein